MNIKTEIKFEHKFADNSLGIDRELLEIVPQIETYDLKARILKLIVDYNNIERRNKIRAAYNRNKMPSQTL